MTATPILCNDLALLFRRVLATLCAELHARAQLSSSAKPEIVLALPGGRGIVGLLNAMRAHSHELPAAVWKRLQIVMIDERVVPLDHKECNFKLLKEQCFDALLTDGLMTSAQLHPFDISSGTLPQVLHSYNETLARLGGTFDIAFLGVGEDAHVAGLFPQHHSILNESTEFISMQDSPKPPSMRMSASRSLIERSGVCFALFIGEGKRQALAQYQDGQLSVQACPAKIVDRCAKGFLVSDLT